MDAPLASPTCCVMTAEWRVNASARAKGPRYVARAYSYHFGTTSATHDAVQLRQAGHRMVWIERTSATVPGKVRRRG